LTNCTVGAHRIHMFTETLKQRVLGSDLVNLLTGPHGVDRYTEVVDPAWTRAEGRAKVVDVRRTTPRSVTLLLAPNQTFTDTGRTLRAGQYVNVAVEIDGRRHTRCYSPANAEGAGYLELTIGQHDGGLVSTFLREHARRGMVVGLTGAGGDFVLPAQRPRRILFVSGGSGITPVMAMVRTLVDEGHAGEIAFVHYARARAEACYHDELAALPNVRVLHGYTRSNDGDLDGRFDASHLAAAMPQPDVVFVCGPAALVDAVREHCPDARSESFVPPTLDVPAKPSGGRVTFADSAIEVTDDGRSLLEQAESAGLTPANGCRMGICQSCVVGLLDGHVRDLRTGVEHEPGSRVQTCVSAASGDCVLDV